MQAGDRWLVPATIGGERTQIAIVGWDWITAQAASDKGQERRARLGARLERLRPNAARVALSVQGPKRGPTAWAGRPRKSD
jgi:hypothetical protein